MRKLSRLGAGDNVRQSAVVNGTNSSSENAYMSGTHHGIIADVTTVDNARNVGTPYGVYTLYTIKLAPSGQMLYNVPAMSWGGHYLRSDTSLMRKLPLYSIQSLVSDPPDGVQNTDETPYVIDQPVIVTFIQGHEMSPIILGPMHCMRGGSGQKSAEYPKKSGSFQGANWSINKTGSAELDLPTTQNLTIKVNGKILCYITDGVVDLGANDPADGTAGTQRTILGDAFKSYMTSLISTLNSHTHTPGTLVAGSTAVTGISGGATSSPFSAPADGGAGNIYATNVKVK